MLRFLCGGFPIQVRVIPPQVAPFSDALVVATGAIGTLWNRDSALFQVTENLIDAPSPLSEWKPRKHEITINPFAFAFVGA